MTTIDELIAVPWVEYGRTRAGADCWGIVRLAREAIRGDLLPSYDNVNAENAGMTQAAHEVAASGFRETLTPRPGAIAAVWRGGMCTHVGIVVDIDNCLAVLESNPKTGVRWMKKADFERRYGFRHYGLTARGVTYHDNN